MSQRERVPTIEELEVEFVAMALDHARGLLASWERLLLPAGSVLPLFVCDTERNSRLSTPMQDVLVAGGGLRELCARAREITEVNGATIGVLVFRSIAITALPTLEDRGSVPLHVLAERDASMVRDVDVVWVVVQGPSFRRADAYEITLADGVYGLGERLPDRGGDSRAPDGAGDDYQYLFEFFVREPPPRARRSARRRA